jgi:hypothetical protein
LINDATDKSEQRKGHTRCADLPSDLPSDPLCGPITRKDDGERTKDGQWPQKTRCNGAALLRPTLHGYLFLFTQLWAVALRLPRENVTARDRDPLRYAPPWFVGEPGARMQFGELGVDTRL